VSNSNPSGNLTSDEKEIAIATGARMAELILQFKKDES
jgi:hypothetical protein